jgi:hypothetical protein
MKTKVLLIPAVILAGVAAGVAAQQVEHAAAKASFELNAAQLDGVTGGIALLLPAVQKAREAAAAAPVFDGAQLTNPGSGASWWEPGALIVEIADPGNPVTFLDQLPTPSPER